MTNEKTRLEVIEARLDAWAEAYGGCVPVEAECELRAIRGMIMAARAAQDRWLRRVERWSGKGVE